MTSKANAHSYQSAAARCATLLSRLAGQVDYGEPLVRGNENYEIVLSPARVELLCDYATRSLPLRFDDGEGTSRAECCLRTSSATTAPGMVARSQPPTRSEEQLKPRNCLDSGSGKHTEPEEWALENILRTAYGITGSCRRLNTCSAGSDPFELARAIGRPWSAPYEELRSRSESRAVLVEASTVS
jgi:hypothetical protein